MTFTEILTTDFYNRDPREVAVDLLGCVLAHRSQEGAASGVIVETEAYRPEDPACHAYKGPTMRNRTMFGASGRAYVYLSYGIHALLNVVCEEEGVGSAVLIRALRPVKGLDLMRKRRANMAGLCNGPGKLTQALGIGLHHDANDLTQGDLTILPGEAPDSEIVATTRIGITRGAEFPWRYLIENDENVSAHPEIICGRGLSRELESRL